MPCATLMFSWITLAQCALILSLEPKGTAKTPTNIAGNTGRCKDFCACLLPGKGAALARLATMSADAGKQAAPRDATSIAITICLTI